MIKRGFKQRKQKKEKEIQCDRNGEKSTLEQMDEQKGGHTQVTQVCEKRRIREIVVRKKEKKMKVKKNEFKKKDKE